MKQPFHVQKNTLALIYLKNLAKQKQKKTMNRSNPMKKSFQTVMVSPMKWYLILLAAVLSPGVAQPADRPNIVVVLTDDQGWGDHHVHGNTALSTPNIDRMARDGAQFDRFYVSPVCSLTRAEFLTGRHHVRCGVYDTSAGGERVNPDESRRTLIGRAANRPTKRHTRETKTRSDKELSTIHHMSLCLAVSGPPR